MEATGVLRGKTRRALGLDPARRRGRNPGHRHPDRSRPSAGCAGSSPARARWSLSPTTTTSPASRCIAWDDVAARAELVHALVSDALDLLSACEAVDRSRRQRGARAARPRRRPGRRARRRAARWRIVRGVAQDRVISVVDPESPPHAQVPRRIPRRLQGAPRRRARDRARHRRRDSPRPARPTDRPASSCLAARTPGLQVLADGAYGSGETLAHSARPDTTGRSSPSRPPRRCPVASTVTTSSSTRTRGTVTCPAGHVVAITQAALRDVRTSLRELPAPIPLHQRQGRTQLHLTLTTRNSSSLDAPGVTGTSFRTIENIDRWSNDRLRGS